MCIWKKINGMTRGTEPLKWELHPDSPWGDGLPLKPHWFQSCCFFKNGPTISQLKMYTQISFDSIFLKACIFYIEISDCHHVSQLRLLLFPGKMVPSFQWFQENFIFIFFVTSQAPCYLISYGPIVQLNCWGNRKTEREVGILGGRHRGSHIAGSCKFASEIYKPRNL